MGGAREWGVRVVLTRAAARARAPTAGVRWPGRKRSRWHPVRCAQYAHVSTQMPTRKTRGFADSWDPDRERCALGEQPTPQR